MGFYCHSVEVNMAEKMSKEERLQAKLFQMELDKLERLDSVQAKLDLMILMYGQVCKHAYEILETQKLSNMCDTCPHLLDCVQIFGVTYRQWKKIDSKVNYYYGDDVEIIKYKKPVRVLEAAYNLPKIDRTRKMYESRPGVWSFVDDTKYSLLDLHKNLVQSAKRAFDNFYGYALSNDWDWFVTITFDPKQVDRHKYDDISDLWTAWLKKIKRFAPELQALIVSEEHEDGAWHYHGFFANIHKLSLTVVYYPDNYYKKHLAGTPIYNTLGDICFNMPAWDLGYSVVNVLPAEQNQRRVVNYCCKYLLKSINVNYGKKKFYRTRNIEFKSKDSFIMDAKSYKELSEASQYNIFKDTPRYQIWRTVDATAVTVQKN